MSKDQLVGRILSGEARIPGNALRTGNLSGDDWNRLAEAAGYLSQAQIYICLLYTSCADRTRKKSLCRLKRPPPAL